MPATITVLTAADLEPVVKRLAALEARVFTQGTPAPAPAPPSPPPPAPSPPPPPAPTPVPIPAPVPAPGPTASVAVGVSRPLKTIRQGYDAINDGGTIVLDPDTYLETFVLQKSCTIKCGAGRANVKLPPGATPAWGKSILHCAAPIIAFENIDFADAMPPNGGDTSIAAVCADAGVQKLTLTNCNIARCSQGVRSIDGPGQESPFPAITLTGCSITNCGPSWTPPALAHNIYTSHNGSLTATGCRFGPHTVGHAVKSRMGHNVFVDCDFESGNARCIDAPDGGALRVLRGKMTKPPGSSDGTFVGWSMESELHQYGPVTLEGVTFVNQRGAAYVSHGGYNASIPVQVVSPVFVGTPPGPNGYVVGL